MPKALIVLDSNVIVSALLSPNSYASRIIAMWREYKFNLAISHHILTEIKYTLSDPKITQKYRISPQKRSRLLSQLTHSCKMVETNSHICIDVRDPKDNPVIATAINCQADYLVSGDTDLTILNGHKSLGELKIMTPLEFVHEFMSSDELLDEYLNQRENL